MGETKEGQFGEAGDRQGPVCRDPILNEWGCIPEGGEEEGLIKHRTQVKNSPNFFAEKIRMVPLSEDILTSSSRQMF